jgi:glycosyltransferase involved in cell wall biosynthesis
MSTAAGRPSVGVVIPCCNQARYLPAAVASVRAQSAAPVECLVVDDGSTDATAAVAEALAVRLVRQANAGVSAARNAGQAALETELVVFLDADDELLPDAVAAGIEALTRHPAAAAVVGRCQPIDADGRELPARQPDVDGDDLYREWLRRNFVWTPGAAMFRRAALVAIGGFPADLGPAADYAVYLRLARTQPIAYLTRPLVRYRQHDGSMSRDPALMLRATVGALRRERRDAPASMRAAIRDGLDGWRHWYGAQILERLSADLRARRLGRPQARAALTLLRHDPGLVLHRAAAKARRALHRRLVR